MLAEGRLVHEGVRLHYLQWPASMPEESDGTDLFLLHGLSANARYWERLAARFPHRNLVALDQRAHGASDRPESGYAVETVAGDAAASIRELGLGRPVVAGHSWGCTTALALAALHPELVSGLAVIDGPVQPMSERMSWEEAASLMQPPLPRYARLEDAYATVAGYLGDAWGRDLEPSVDAGLVRDGDAWILTLTAEVRRQILRHLYDFQPQLLWPGLEMPALAVFAGGDSMMRAWKEQVALALAGQAPVVDIRWYDSRHDIPQILPDALGDDLERLCLEAGFAEVARRARALEGDFARGALSDWSARDVLVHIVSTQSALASVLRAPAPSAGSGGGKAFDSDRWNASQLRKRAGVPADALIAELEEGTREVRAALREARLETVLGTGPYAGRTVASGMRAMVRHQREHLDQLEAALAG